MKELSIEEKAKRYDEAIKRTKEYAIDGYLDAVAVNDIFPELAESEDERIRKEIISYLKRRLKIDSSIPAAIGYWIAWLEKQGDANKEYWRGYREGKEEILDKYAELEKQGEQKPNYCHHEVDLSNCSEEYRKAYYDGWNNCNMQHSQCRSELDDVVKCLINGMKFYYEANEEATWGTDKWSMPVKHIIEVLEKQDKQKSYGQRQECVDCQFNYAGECKGYCAMKRSEQKPADLPNGEDYGIDGLYAAIDILRKTLGKVEGYQTDDGILEHKCAISAVKKLYKHKPTWSEEDEYE